MKKVILESSPLRSFVKGATWETSGLATVLVISLIFTGNPVTALQVGLSYFPLRLGLYVMHERLWKRIAWGHREHEVDK